MTPKLSYYKLSVVQGHKKWRRERDSNPRNGLPFTRFPSVRLQPLGHLSNQDLDMLSSKALINSFFKGNLFSFIPSKIFG